MQKNPAFFIAIALLFALSSCYREEAVRGNYVIDEKIEKSKNASKEDILKTLGSPSHITAFDPDIWIYIGYKERQYAFFDPKETDRRVLRVVFNSKGKVSDIQKLTAKDGNNIFYSRDKTPVHGNNQGYISQIVRNIGRFEAPQQ